MGFAAGTSVGTVSAFRSAAYARGSESARQRDRFNQDRPRAERSHEDDAPGQEHPCLDECLDAQAHGHRPCTVAAARMAADRPAPTIKDTTKRSSPARVGPARFSEVSARMRTTFSVISTSTACGGGASTDRMSAYATSPSTRLRSRWPARPTPRSRRSHAGSPRTEGGLSEGIYGQRGIRFAIAQGREDSAQATCEKRCKQTWPHDSCGPIRRYEHPSSMPPAPFFDCTRLGAPGSGIQGSGRHPGFAGLH